MVVLVLAGGASAAHAAQPPSLDARAWALLDPADGELLAAHSASRSYPVASTTKLMTAYVSRRALRLREHVVAPEYTPSSSAESLLGLETGERITTHDLLYGLILASGNDAAVALAVASAGSVSAFVERMNASARELGLDDTSYANPIGLDEAGNFSSAEDLVALAAKLRDDPVFRRIFDTPEITLTGGAEVRDVVNRNTLVRTVRFVNGVKTGYTLGAGNVLVASGTRHGVTLISAVLGAPSEEARDSESLELLDYGFSLYRRREVVNAGERLASAALVDQDASLPIAARRTLAVTARRDERVAVAIDAPSEVEGPVSRGERLGRVTVTVDGEPEAHSVLVAAQAAGAAGFGDKLDSALPGPDFVAWLLVALAIGGLAFAAVRLSGSLMGGNREREPPGDER